MYVSHLALVDFRSYEAADVELEPGPNAFVGRNGQGKTNLVEAVGYVATLGSHRVPSDLPLVRAGVDRAVVRSRIVRGDRASTVEVEITPGRANRARINRGQLGRARDVLGILRTVLFAPEDLGLVKGDPSGRRTLLDQLVIQLLPRAAGTLADYERVNRQRSALLKSLRAAKFSGRSLDLGTLEVWDANAAALGAQILAMRLDVVQALRPHVLAAYEQVSEADGRATLGYLSSLERLGGGDDLAVSLLPAESTTAPPSLADLEGLLLGAMAQARSSEIDRGVSLVGPHRDDLVLTLGGLPAKGYASHGESWSFALALRLASFRLLGGGMDDGASPAAEAGDTAPFWDPDFGPDADPVLILDDVFAELDVRRRQRLAELVAPARQVLITAAVPDDVPAALRATTFEVTPGQVRRV